MSNDTTARNATGRAMDLLKVLNRLIDVLGQEISLLREMKPRDMQSLQQDKIILTGAYEAIVAEVRRNPGLFGELDPSLKEQVIKAAGRFQDVLSENARALFAVKEANDRLFKAVARAVEEKRNETRSYASSGTFAHARMAAVETVSLSIDQTL